MRVGDERSPRDQEDRFPGEGELASVPDLLPLAASDSAAAGQDDLVDVVALMVHRLFGIGLVLESASGLADEPVAARLQYAVDELDAVIRDVRAAAFGSGPPGSRPR